MRRLSNLLFFPLLFALAALLVSAPSFSGEPTGKKPQKQKLAKPMINDLETIDGNRIFNYIKNNGQWCSHLNPVGFGMQWPGQSGHSVDFASGVWLGGKVSGGIRTAAAEFASEFQAGPVKPDGTADDATSSRHQILKIEKRDLLNEGFDNPDYALWIDDLYQLGAPILRDANGQPILSATGKRIPDLIGDQMLWMVYNDLNPGLHGALFGSPPLGIEVQNTVWVFNRPDAFGDMIFLKFLLINKGRNAIEDTYIGLWFDIDLGDSNDDVVFCDTTLSLGAFWNDGDDVEFPIPPAVGADFFQGPIVASPGDTANVSGRKIPGFKNLGMASFAKYVRGGPPDTQDPENATQAYNFMTGLNGLGAQIIDPTTNQPTKFVNVSDPEKGTGWVDGIDLGPADRRMLMNSGPFTMETWVDTNGDGLAQVGEPGVQEVVAAFMIAQGTNAKNSATRLKQVDELAQLAYDLNFALPPSPSMPQVTVHNLNGEVLLSWDDEVESYVAADKVDVDEEGNPTEYTFQGYNVYQANSATIGPGVSILKLATFDVADGVGDIKDFVFSEEFGEVVEATVQRAPDTGLQRFYRITADALGGGVPLSNWNKYWFLVTAYGYNPYGVPKILESPFTTIEVQPQPPPGGLKTKTAFNQMIAAINPDTLFNATHTSTGALSDGQLEVVVIDPSKLTGKDYQVTFAIDTVTGQIVWNLDRMDPTGLTRLLSKQTNQAGDEAYTVVDGIKVKIIGPPPEFKRIVMIANGNGSITETAGFDITPAPPYPGYTADWYRDVAQSENATVLNLSNGMQVGGGWFFFVAGGPTVADYETFLGRVLRGTNPARFVPNDYEIRFTNRSNKGIMAFTTEKLVDVPFELWFLGSGTLNDPSDDVRMIPWILDNEHPDGGGVGDSTGIDVFTFTLDHQASGGNNDPYSDWIYWSMPADASPGETGYNKFVADATAGIYDFGGTEHMARTVLMNWNQHQNESASGKGDGPVNAMPDASTIIRIEATKINTEKDVFSFKTAGFEASATVADAKAAAQQVNIFPNPYFGQNRAEINPVERFVTMTHLPAEGVTIRIFTLAGDLVNIIDDRARSQQGTLGTHTALWNLRNANDVPIASGIYFIHVDMGSLGQKVLKAAVFMPEERLDKF